MLRPLIRWRLRGCPRCKGDLNITKNDQGGLTESCLQCGYTVDLNTPKLPYVLKRRVRG
jgi:hypothetical protein